MPAQRGSQEAVEVLLDQTDQVGNGHEVVVFLQPKDAKTSSQSLQPCPMLWSHTRSRAHPQDTVPPIMELLRRRLDTENQVRHVIDRHALDRLGWDDRLSNRFEKTL